MLRVVGVEKVQRGELLPQGPREAQFKTNLADLHPSSLRPGPLKLSPSAAEADSYLPEATSSASVHQKSPKMQQQFMIWRKCVFLKPHLGPKCPHRPVARGNLRFQEENPCHEQSGSSVMLWIVVCFSALPQEDEKAVDGGMVPDAKGKDSPEQTEGSKWQRPRLSRKSLMKCCLVKWIIASTTQQGPGRCTRALSHTPKAFNFLPCRIEEL